MSDRAIFWCAFAIVAVLVIIVRYVGNMIVDKGTDAIRNNIVHNQTVSSSNNSTRLADRYGSSNIGKSTSKSTHSGTDWKCICGQWNPSFFGTCSCGKRKREAAAELKDKSEKTKEAIRLKNKAKETEVVQATSEYEKIELLKEYKELLDSGAITEEEFNTKKASILK